MREVLNIKHTDKRNRALTKGDSSAIKSMTIKYFGNALELYEGASAFRCSRNRKEAS